MMFKKLATVRPFQTWRIAPAWTTAFHNNHSNDNRLGFRRPADRRARPKPAPVCHWIKVGGRLECRWTAAGNDAPRHDAEPRPSGSFGSIRCRSARPAA
jgi:hypothetical protein